MVGRVFVERGHGLGVCFGALRSRGRRCSPGRGRLELNDRRSIDRASAPRAEAGPFPQRLRLGPPRTPERKLVLENVRTGSDLPTKPEFVRTGLKNKIKKPSFYATTGAIKQATRSVGS